MLDRFVFSVYTRSLTDRLSTLPVKASLARAVTIAHLVGTLFIRCDFSQAWTRVTSAAAALGFKESRGEAYNHEFAPQLEKAFRYSSLTADRLEVENTDSLDQLLSRTGQAVGAILQSLRPTESINNN